MFCLGCRGVAWFGGGYHLLIQGILDPVMFLDTLWGWKGGEGPTLLGFFLSISVSSSLIVFLFPLGLLPYKSSVLSCLCATDDEMTINFGKKVSFLLNRHSTLWNNFTFNECISLIHPYTSITVYTIERTPTNLGWLGSFKGWGPLLRLSPLQITPIVTKQTALVNL